MKQISKDLIEFLNKHISEKINKIPKLRFSNKSTSLIKTLFNQMQIAESQWAANQNKIIDSSIKINCNMQGLPKGYNYDYCPEKIKQKIKETIKHGFIYTFKIENREFEVAILYQENNRFNIKDAIKRVYMWLFVSNFHAPAKCSQKMNIYLYLTDEKKLLPTKLREHIGEENANSAATTSCQKVTEINLYRDEEWFKVLIHETFHCLGLDFSEFDKEQTNKCILELFPLKSDVRLFETYCEMWAEIINVMFISHFTTKVENQDLKIKKMIKMLEREQEFSLFQCAKVLNYFGLSYTELYEKTSISHTNRVQKYKEETHILSYFIIKSLMMFFANEYIEWAVNHNGNTINFGKEPTILDKNLTEYCGFVREHYQNPEYIDALNSLDIWFSKIKKYNHVELQTLRMSLHEI